MLMYRIGKIINTHGLKGEIKVQQTTDFEELFHAGKTVYIDINGVETEFLIEQQRTHKHHLLILFKHVDSLEEAEKLKGFNIKVKQEQLPQLGENEYHYHEIIGCHMYTTDGEHIGEIVNILSPGANDVWVTRNDEGDEHLIPFIDEVVKDVNVKDKKVMIELMEGLLD